MLQVTSETQIQECPACGQEFQFNQVESWYARLDVAPIDLEKVPLKAVKPINEVKPKP